MHKHKLLSLIVASVLANFGVGEADAAKGIAGIYDFDTNNLNDMRKAFRICAFSRYQDGECPDIWKKCHRYPLLGFSGSKCHEPPIFTNKNDDAHKALNDGQRMLNGGGAGNDENKDAQPPTADQEAQAAQMAEEAGVTTEDPCAGSADAQACVEARVVDAGGVVAYEAQNGPISDDLGAAIAAANAAGQPVVAAILGATPPPDATSEDELVETEGDPSQNYADYEAEYGIPSIEATASTGETVAP